MKLLATEKVSQQTRSSRRPASHRPPPNRGLIAAVGLGVVLMAALLLGAFRLSRHGAIPNLKLAGISVAGLDRSSITKVARLVAERRANEKVTMVRSAALGAKDQASTATRQDLGYRVDVKATVDEVLNRGRQGNPLASLADHLISSVVSIDVQPIERVDPRVFDQWVSDTVRDLSLAPREGDLEFSGATVEEIDPAPGIGIQAGELRARVPGAMKGKGAVKVTLVPVRLPARMSIQAVKEALADAQYALSGSVRLMRGKKSLRFSPMEIGEVLEAEPIERNGQLVLHLVGDRAAMKRIAREQIHVVEVPAVDARLVPSGDGVDIIPSKNGFGFDPKQAAAALVKAATSPSREARMKGLVIRPDFSTKDARALHIDQVVSSFTTYYECCPPRVTNIHRIADILDGTVVRPGDLFSVNAIVGERTPEEGFVMAPGISNGEIVDQQGGGISQFGTTIFNAVFFGGYKFVEFQHHSYYFTRYPAGRDATISWTSPDFAFRNDSKYGVYIDTSYTDTSVTVTFYGHKNYKVTAATARPYNFIDPPTRCKVNKALAKGVSNVTQKGSQGFDILVKRVFRYEDGTTRVEEFFTHYKPEPIIVEQRSCAGGVISPSASASP